MSTKVDGIRIPPVSKEFADFMDKVFPAKEFRVGMDKDILVMNAGERAVIRKIRQAVRSFETTGDFEALHRKDDAKKLPWYARLVKCK